MLCRAESAIQATDYQDEMDDVYALPYMRTYHPSYEAAGGVPAIRRGEIQSGQQPWLLWWLQFLCPDVPSGKNYPDQKP